MLHGWQAKVADKTFDIEGADDLVELYKEDDKANITRCYLNAEEAELLATEILRAVEKIKYAGLSVEEVVNKIESDAKDRPLDYDPGNGECMHGGG